MQPSQRFFDRTCTLKAVAYSQDASGGPVLTPTPSAFLVACAVQQGSPPIRLDPAAGQRRRGSTAEVMLFFAPGYSQYPGPSTSAIRALKANDQVPLDDGRTLVLDGPAYDESGRGACYAASGKYLN